MYGYVDKKEEPNSFRKAFVIASVISLIAPFFYFISQKFNLNDFTFINISLWIIGLHFIIAFANTTGWGKIGLPFESIFREIGSSKFVRGYLLGSIISMLIILGIAKVIF